MYSPDFKISDNIRSRTRYTFLSQTVSRSKEKSELLGCSHDFLQNGITFQFTENMTPQSFGSIWQFDHTVFGSFFNFLVRNNLKRVLIGLT